MLLACCFAAAHAVTASTTFTLPGLGEQQVITVMNPTEAETIGGGPATTLDTGSTGELGLSQFPFAFGSTVPTRITGIVVRILSLAGSSGVTISSSTVATKSHQIHAGCYVQCHCE